mgnify:FL=1
MANINDLDIIDAHFHQWDPKNTPHVFAPLNKLFGWNPKLYHWICNKVTPKHIAESMGSMKYIVDPYLPKDFQQDINGHNVKAAVFSPYSWKVKSDVDLADEARFVEKLFAQKPSSVKFELGAIVGNARLENTAELQALIDNYRKASGRVVGLRDMLDWHDDSKVASYAREKNMSTNKEWLKGFEIISKNNLFFDAFVFHHQLHEMDALARAYPTTQIILSHMGTPMGAMGPFAGYGESPAEREQIIKEWQEGMARLSENKNVVVKLTGLFIPKLGWGFHNRAQPPSLNEIVDKLKPLVDFTINQFGAKRCMFGSHFTPDKVSLSYSLMYQAYKEIIKDRPEQEQKMLLADNARRVYKIKH